MRLWYECVLKSDVFISLNVSNNRWTLSRTSRITRKSTTHANVNPPDTKQLQSTSLPMD
jgi:hypothetical protein